MISAIKTNWKKYFFIFYAWITALIWGIVIFWFSGIENLKIAGDDNSLLIERITYLLSYGFLLILIFRALISTFRLTIDRLSYSRSKKERSEDREFVIITETLLLTNAILITSIIAIINYHYLDTVEGRINDTYSFLTNIIGILIAALITYSWPIISTLELKILKMGK